ncbi:hypothetical protein MPTK1_Vg01130 [Marchantia polymorpha subsp. ruderalis]|uniref:Uncharacterized protein n=1 Tax=Marchantia polymorpha TaxID=3197 RepID=A0A2R6VWZ8_MARPO|nr:hypothetical protein MARPO_YA0009 [Marchantia polymorpha]BBN20655.1 hypothetical protein Mp_Vg01130 [Marchantia polymorpha subsp. ruderalis]|eukprot:PTQ26120.1 hypothetical protein MARPO_YA0009 [Marchantia polymorpha]
MCILSLLQYVRTYLAISERKTLRILKESERRGRHAVLEYETHFYGYLYCFSCSRFATNVLVCQLAFGVPGWSIKQGKDREIWSTGKARTFTIPSGFYVHLRMYPCCYNTAELWSPARRTMPPEWKGFEQLLLVFRRCMMFVSKNASSIVE